MRVGNAVVAMDVGLLVLKIVLSFLIVDERGRLNCVEDPIDDFNL